MNLSSSRSFSLPLLFSRFKWSLKVNANVEILLLIKKKKEKKRKKKKKKKKKV